MLTHTAKVMANRACVTLQTVSNIFCACHCSRMKLPLLVCRETFASGL